MNSGEPGGNCGVIVERSGLMSSERTEHERDGGQEADGETAAELRGGRWQQSCGGAHGSRAFGGGGKPKAASSAGATQREGCGGGTSQKASSAGAEGRNAAERDAEGDLRGGDEREEMENGANGGTGMEL
jgi:hypothetical protein